MAFVEDRNSGSRAAEVDAGDTQLGFVVDQCRQARGIGGGDQRLDLQMAAVQPGLGIRMRARIRNMRVCWRA